MRSKTNLRATVLSISLILLLGIVVYSNTFSVPFLFDDNHIIVENPKLENLSPYLKSIFNGSRSLTDATFALNYHFGKTRVWGYHLVNLIIHLTSGIALYLIFRLTLNSPEMRNRKIAGYSNLLPLFSALVFVGHPIQTQSVTYLVQRYSSLAAMFYLLSLIFFIKARLSYLEKGKIFSPHHLFYYLGSIIFGISAMSCKETAVTLPAIILLYEYCFIDQSFNNWKKRLLYLSPLLILVFKVPVHYIPSFLDLTQLFSHPETTISEVSQSFQLTHGDLKITRINYLLTQFNVILTYIRLMFLPVNQNLDYDYPLSQSLFEFPTFFSFVGLMAIVTFAIWSFKRSRLISFGIFWFLITLSVTSSIIPIIDIVFEHRLYLPSAGFIIFFTVVIYQILTYFCKKNIFLTQRGNMILSIVFIPIIMLYSMGTYQRNRVWKDGFALWHDTVKKSPYKARPHNNLGTAYIDRDLPDKAMEEFKKALEINPHYPPAHYNLGIVYAEKNLYAQAIREYQETLRLDPDFTDTHGNLGIAYRETASYDLAINELKTVLRIKPHDRKALNHLQETYEQKTLFERILNEYQEALRFDPRSAEVRYKRGIIYSLQGLYDQAIKEYQDALKIESLSAQIRFYLGKAYAKKGLYNQAIKEYQESLMIEPYSAEAHREIASIYLTKRKEGKKALFHFRQSIKIDPDQRLAETIEKTIQILASPNL